MLKLLAMGNCDVTTNRVVYMKTWKHIRRCIRLIDPFNQLDTEVITCKYFRSQVQSIRKYRADDQKNGHTAEHDRGGFVKSLFIIKEQISQCDCNISKPQQVRNDEIFTKRDVVIEYRMDYKIIVGHMAFQISKPWKLNKSI